MGEVEKLKKNINSHFLRIRKKLISHDFLYLFISVLQIFAQDIFLFYSHRGRLIKMPSAAHLLT